jgi:glycerol-3-phosphate dehydrogenase
MGMGNSQREQALLALDDGGIFDLLIIGGGATGLGLAVDASARGLRTALVEAQDFAKGTTSRSTKLVHGGVRYLAQGRIGLVHEALQERSTLLSNAPHLSSALPFVLPCSGWVDKGFYGAGLKAYEALSGRRGLGQTELLSRDEVCEAVPGIRAGRHAGGWRYWDAQFDDARLAVALARTAQAQGAVVLNHCEVQALLRQDSSGRGRVCGAQVHDHETGRTRRIGAHCVVNATGVWVDAVRRMAVAESAGSSLPAMISPSQGVHLVVESGFLGGHHALLVPRTSDGRVVFAVPWLGSVVLGTTDTPRDDLPLEPRPFKNEVDFILQEAGRYLSRPLSRQDVRSAWAGLRPLVKPDGGPASTGVISREHTVQVAAHGLVTVTGGKWTTYRTMAEDVLQACADAGLIKTLRPSSTAALLLKGAPAGHSRGTSWASRLSQAPGLHLYGQDAEEVLALPGADRWLAPGLSEAMVRFAVRQEMARTVEDVLARRSRLLFLDAAAAQAVATPVAALIAQERACSPSSVGLEAFQRLADQYASVP